MSRRWKIALALAVVGIAGFLVWALLSAAKPPLTIRFSGYVTNSTLRLGGTLPPWDGSVFAVFAVTNHTAHTMTVGALSQIGFGGRTNREMGRWLDATNYHPTMGVLFPQLPSGQGAQVAARVFPTNSPISMTVADYSFLGQNTWWNRIRRRLPWNKQRPYATATSEPR